MQIALLLALVAGNYQGGETTPTGKGLYTITVASDVAWSDYLNAANFRWIDPSITPVRFGVRSEAEQRLPWERDLVMVEVDRLKPSDEIISILRHMGLCPATATELVAFVAKYPHFATQFPIAALGTVWNDRYGTKRVLIAGPYKGRRKLDIAHWDATWTLSVRFLARRTICGKQKED